MQLEMTWNPLPLGDQMLLTIGVTDYDYSVMFNRRRVILVALKIWHNFFAWKITSVVFISYWYIPIFQLITSFELVQLELEQNMGDVVILFYLSEELEPDLLFCIPKVDVWTIFELLVDCWSGRVAFLKVWKWLSLEKYQPLLSFLGPFVVPETIPTSVRSHLPVLQRPEYLLAD